MGPKKRLNYDTFMKKDAEYANLWYTQSVSVKNSGGRCFLSRHLQTGVLQNMQKETKNEFPDY